MLRVTVLVALVAVLLSCATALATRTLLIGQVDDQLNSVIARFQNPGGPGGGPGGGLGLSGQPIGTTFAAYDSSGNLATSGVLGERGSRTPLGNAAADGTGHGTDRSGQAHRHVPGMGHYRVAAYQATIEVNNGTTPASWWSGSR